MAYAETDIILPSSSGTAMPEVCRIHLSDIRYALARGLDDFWAMPTHVVFLCLIYPVIGIVLGNATFNGNAIALLYPLAAGFALIGPLAGVWLFELSRRRELGLDTSWRHAFDIVHSPSMTAIAALGALLLAIFGIWIAAAESLFTSYFGYGEMTVGQFARRVLTTDEGRQLIIAGNLVGFGFAVIAAAISVISFPLLLDRNVGFAVAVVTSIRTVLRNPLEMAAWGIIVAVALALGSLPFFLGLAIVMPVLGHATWHLYRRAVVPVADPHPHFQPGPRRRRYAADFPAVLFQFGKSGEAGDGEASR